VRVRDDRALLDRHTLGTAWSVAVISRDAKTHSEYRDHEAGRDLLFLRPKPYLLIHSVNPLGLPPVSELSPPVSRLESAIVLSVSRGPNGFKRSYTLAASAGEHQALVIANVLLKLLPAKVPQR
jgi:hypothetical protein